MKTPEMTGLYESPIHVFQTEQRMRMENGIMEAVNKLGVVINKDELIKALAYDRDQYAKGFEDGRAWAVEQLKRKRALTANGTNALCCFCKHNGTSVCVICENLQQWEWRDLPEPEGE